MKRIKTIGDLKDHLKDILFELEDYDDEEEIDIKRSTYFLENKDNFIATQEGFIDLGNPCDLQECEWCEARFNKKDLIHKGKWCLCEECFKYLESRGEDFE